MTAAAARMLIQAVVSKPALEASLNWAASAALKGGQSAGKNFMEGLAPKQGDFSAFEKFGQMMQREIPAMMANVGEAAATSMMQGLTAFKSGDVQGVFESVQGAMSNAVEVGTEVGQTFAQLAGRWAPMLEGAIGAVGQSMGTFVQVGGDYLQMIIEIGDKYSSLTRTLSESTIDMKQIVPLQGMVRDIMASGAIDTFEDVSTTIGRFARTMNLAGPELRAFTENYAALAEMIGSQNAVDIAGIMKAYNVPYEDTADELTKLGNITRGLGGDANRLVDAMIRSGPAMRSLGFDASSTALLFAGMNAEGLRGTKLVYGMGQLVDKIGEAAQKGMFGTYLKDADKELGQLAGQTLTTADAFKILMADTKKLMDLGTQQGRDAAYGLLSNYTTPQNATLMAELIQKQAITTPAALKAATEAYKQDMGEVASETADLANQFSNASQTFQASLAPIGLAFANAIGDKMAEFTDWMSKNQDVVQKWGLKVAEVVMTGFQYIGNFAAEIITYTGHLADGVTATMGVVLQPFVSAFSMILDLLEHLPDFLGGKVFDDAKSILDGFDGVLAAMRDTDISSGLDFVAEKIQAGAAKIPVAMDSLRETAAKELRAQKIETAFKVEKTDAPGSTGFGYKGIEATEAGERDPLNSPSLELRPENAAEVTEKLAQLGIDLVFRQGTTMVDKVIAHSQEAVRMWEEWYRGEVTRKKESMKVPIQYTDEYGVPSNKVEDLLEKQNSPLEIKATITPTGVTPGASLPGGAAAAPAPTPLYTSPYPLNTGGFGGSGAGTYGGASAGAPSGTLPGATGGPTHQYTPGVIPMAGLVGGGAPQTGNASTNQPGVQAAKEILGALFPAVNEIGGARQDRLQWHNEGKALDIMIPNWDTAQGKALGDTIQAYLMKNFEALGVKDIIWQDIWTNPADPSTSYKMGIDDYNQGHYNHLHISFDDASQVNLDKLNLPPEIKSALKTAVAAGTPIPKGAPPLPTATPPAATTPIPTATPLAASTAAPVKKEGWTYSPDGKPLSAPPSDNEQFFDAVADWYTAKGQEPPPAYAKYGTKQPTSSDAAGVPAASPFASVKTSQDLAAFSKTSAWLEATQGERESLLKQVIDTANKESAAATVKAETAEKFKRAAEEAEKTENTRRQAAEQTAKTAAQEAARQADINTPEGRQNFERGISDILKPGVSLGKPEGGYGDGKNPELSGQGSEVRPDSWLRQPASKTLAPLVAAGVEGWNNGKNTYTTAKVPDSGQPAYPSPSGEGAGSIVDGLKGAWNWVGDTFKGIGDWFSSTREQIKTEQTNLPAPQQLTRAAGGPVFGAGTATSDSIPAWLSNGEFVQNAAAVSHYGTDFMHAVNNRKLPKFSNGGAIDTTGAQVDTIGLAEAVAANGGVQDIHLYRGPDGYNEHSSGQAADFMVSQLGVAATQTELSVGNMLNMATLALADKFGVMYTIWQNKIWKPDGSSKPYGADPNNATQAHKDHVHARTRGGGYPEGGGPGELGTGDKIPSGMSKTPAENASGSGFIRLGLNSYSDGGSVGSDGNSLQEELLRQTLQGKVYEPDWARSGKRWNSPSDRKWSSYADGGEVDDYSSLPPLALLEWLIDKLGWVGDLGGVEPHPEQRAPKGMLGGSNQFSEGGLVDLQKELLRSAFQQNAPSADAIAAADLAEKMSRDRMGFEEGGLVELQKELLRSAFQQNAPSAAAVAAADLAEQISQKGQSTKPQSGLSAVGDFLGGTEGGWKDKLSKGVSNALSGSFWLDKMGVDTSTDGWNQKGAYIFGLSELTQGIGKLAAGDITADVDGRFSGKDLVDFFALPDAKKEMGTIASGETGLGEKGLSALAMAAFIPGLGKGAGTLADAARAADVSGPGIVRLPIDLLESYGQKGKPSGALVKEMGQKIEGGIDETIELGVTPFDGLLMDDWKRGDAKARLSAARTLGMTDYPVVIDEIIEKSIAEYLGSTKVTGTPHTKEYVEAVYAARQASAHAELLKRAQGFPALPKGTEFRFLEGGGFPGDENNLFAWLGIDGKPAPGVASYDALLAAGKNPYYSGQPGNAGAADGWLRTYNDKITWPYDADPNPAGRWHSGLHRPGEIAMIQSMGNPGMGTRLVEQALTNPLSVMADIAHSAELLPDGLKFSGQDGWYPRVIESTRGQFPGDSPGFSNGDPELPYLPRQDVQERRLFPGWKSGGAIKRASGGAVFGAGTATSDSIPAWLSNGEFVQNAGAVAHYGTDFMHAVNSRKLPMPRFAPGGPVDDSQYVTAENGVKIPLELWNRQDQFSAPGTTGRTSPIILGTTTPENNPFINPPSDPEEMRNAILGLIEAQVSRIKSQDAGTELQEGQKAILEDIAAVTRDRDQALLDYAPIKAQFDLQTSMATTGTTMNQTLVDLEAEMAEKITSLNETLAGLSENLKQNEQGVNDNARERFRTDEEGYKLKQSDTKTYKSDKDAESLGRGLVEGLFEGFGFDGDLFGKAFTEWGSWKLATGLAGFGLNLAQATGAVPAPGGGAGLGPGTGVSALFGAAQSTLPGVASQLPQIQANPDATSAASVTPALTQSQPPSGGGVFNTNVGGGPAPGPQQINNFNGLDAGGVKSAVENTTHGMAAMAPPIPVGAR